MQASVNLYQSSVKQFVHYIINIFVAILTGGWKLNCSISVFQGAFKMWVVFKLWKATKKNMVSMICSIKSQSPFQAFVQHLSYVKLKPRAKKLSEDYLELAWVPSYSYNKDNGRTYFVALNKYCCVRFRVVVVSIGFSRNSPWIFFSNLSLVYRCMLLWSSFKEPICVNDRCTDWRQLHRKSFWSVVWNSK